MSSRGRSNLTTRVKGHRSFGNPALMANSYSNVKLVSLMQEGPVQRSSTAVGQGHAGKTAEKLLSPQKQHILNRAVLAASCVCKVIGTDCNNAHTNQQMSSHQRPHQRWDHQPTAGTCADLLTRSSRWSWVLWTTKAPKCLFRMTSAASAHLSLFRRRQDPRGPMGG